jgi:hypothetical protein
VVDGAGDRALESITLADRANDTVEEVSAAALFIMIGGEPHTRGSAMRSRATRRVTSSQVATFSSSPGGTGSMTVNR